MIGHSEQVDEWSVESAVPKPWDNLELPSDRVIGLIADAVRLFTRPPEDWQAAKDYLSRHGECDLLELLQNILAKRKYGGT